MTTSSEQLDTVPGEIQAALPETTRERLRGKLGEVTKCLGERWLGGPWLPEDDPERNHTQAKLDDTAATFAEDLAGLLGELPRELKRGERVYLLLFLWQECWDRFVGRDLWVDGAEERRSGSAA